MSNNRSPACPECATAGVVDDYCDKHRPAGGAPAEHDFDEADQPARLNWQNTYSPWHALAQAQAAELARLREALKQIAAWAGLPEHYGWNYGSNGERDFMREVARRALSASPGRADTQEANDV